METVNKLIIAFMFFSFAGWVWESIYCTIGEHKWANRGFLYGPFCPIYGFGGVIGLIVHLMIGRQMLPQLSGQVIFLIGFLVSMILEYPTSWLLEKLFSARWWDYSDIPFNINGRTSIPTSIGFGVAAILVMNYMEPAMVSVLDKVPAWMTGAGAMLSVAFLSADITLTVSVLTNFQKYVARIDDAFQNRMTDAVFRAFQVENRLYRTAVEGISVFKLPVRKAELANRLREGRLAEFIRQRLGESEEKKAEETEKKTVKETQIVKLADRPELKEKAAKWFSSKWKIPEEAYLESIEDSFTKVVPSWYLYLIDGEIAGGLGVIENDFHERKDLTPNVCAVYTEPEHRNKGIAGKLLNHVREDMKAHGIDTLYLLTDHTGFYERYGWEFYCMALGDGEEKPSRMYKLSDK